MTSIIIPAHNEAAVIGRTLKYLLSSVGNREVEIVVVCNACSDNTAEIARSTSPRVMVLETPQPGKCAAINLGEQHVKTYPRIYLDADIQVSANFVADMERPLRGETARVAWPNVTYDLSQSSWQVAAFYRVWTALPYNRPGRIGVGAYALSALGRSKFDKFPEIISDDGFIRGLFGPDDRAIINTCHTIVQPPRDLSSLIAVRTRSRMGVYQLWQKRPDVMREHSARKELRIRDFAGCLRPSVLLSAPVYALIVWLTKRRARQRIKSDQPAVNWDRDLSSRSTG